MWKLILCITSLYFYSVIYSMLFGIFFYSKNIEYKYHPHITNNNIHINFI
jgi:hypothetical protein